MTTDLERSQLTVLLCYTVIKLFYVPLIALTLLSVIVQSSYLAARLTYLLTYLFTRWRYLQLVCGGVSSTEGAAQL